MRVTALAGGVGGAKLLRGLQRALPTGALTAVVNTGDDATMYGLHVSPDVDIVTYWLAGIADLDRGWGVKGDTFTAIEALARLGEESWFRLGDADLATCLLRTRRLAEGWTLSKTTEEVRVALRVPTRILPMSDDPVRTTLRATDGRTLEFQEYFVRDRTEPEIIEITYGGLERAAPAPGVQESIHSADLIVLCPSNPMLSLAPILGLRGLRDALRTHPRVVAVSPLVGGAALKGPADRLLRSLGHDASATGVSGLYRDFCDVFVLDEVDAHERQEVAATGSRPVVLDTVMSDASSAEALAERIIAL
jgi:LPPG:FO 2-phospho-L-lactate transferase